MGSQSQIAVGWQCHIYTQFKLPLLPNNKLCGFPRQGYHGLLKPGWHKAVNQHQINMQFKLPRMCTSKLRLRVRHESNINMESQHTNKLQSCKLSQDCTSEHKRFRTNKLSCECVFANDTKIITMRCVIQRRIQISQLHLNGRCDKPKHATLPIQNTLQTHYNITTISIHYHYSFSSISVQPQCNLNTISLQSCRSDRFRVADICATRISTADTDRIDKIVLRLY